MSGPDVDLDINNYDLNDILKLFHLTPNFNAADMKQAKQKVLRLHPDKSRLDSKYFLFYSRAYKMLYSMHEFNNRASAKSSNTNTAQYFPDDTNEDERSQALNVFFSNNKDLKGDASQFNTWFNQEFEKQKVRNDETDEGYGEWLTSNEGVHEETSATSLSAMSEQFARKKREARELVVHRGVDENILTGNSAGGTSLAGDSIDNYSSGLFSDLPYQDLKQAHEESVIPVTDDDYAEIPKFRNVNEYSTFRNNQNTVPLSEQQALRYLQEREKQEETMSSQRAYKLAKQTEDVRDKSKDFWSSMLKLKNGKTN